jgi:hypothetical protein
MNRICHQIPQLHPDEKDRCVRSILGNVVSDRSLQTGLHCTVFLAFTIHLTVASAAAQPSTKSKSDPKSKGSESTSINIDSERLPPDYAAPPERLSIFDLEQPLASKEEMERLKRESTDFFKVKSSGDLSQTGQKAVESRIRYLLAEMTLKEKLYDLPILRKKFVEQVGQARQPDMAKFIGETILKQIPPLLKNQYHVRLQAVEILGEINFYPAYELLLQVLQAKDIRDDEADGQPEAMKVAAAKSLIRIIRFDKPLPKDRLAIAQAAVAELEKPDLHWWLQVRLIDLLRYSDVPGIDTKNNDKPFVVDALMALVRDQKRGFRVRTKACYALGRVPFPKGSVKLDEVVTAISDCALQVANAAAAKPNDPEWKSCIWNIYLAFHKGGTAKDPDKDAEDKAAGGLLEKNKTAVQPAYQVIVPIVNDIMADKAPDAASLRNLSAFVRSRQS